MSVRALDSAKTGKLWSLPPILQVSFSSSRHLFSSSLDNSDWPLCSLSHVWLSYGTQPLYYPPHLSAAKKAAHQSVPSLAMSLTPESSLLSLVHSRVSTILAASTQKQVPITQRVVLDADLKVPVRLPVFGGAWCINRAVSHLVLYPFSHILGFIAKVTSSSQLVSTISQGKAEHIVVIVREKKNHNWPSPVLGYVPYQAISRAMDRRHSKTSGSSPNPMSFQVRQRRSKNDSVPGIDSVLIRAWNA